MKQRLRHLLYFILLIAIDQGTKYWAKTILLQKGPFSIIPKVFRLQYHENDGAVWGILSGKMNFLIILTVVLVAFLIYFYFKIPRNKRFTPILLIWVFILAGAIGNFIDRVTLGYVVDFIYFELIDFPLFNVADMYLTVSCFLLFALAVFYYKEKDFEFIDHIFTREKKSQEKSDTDRKDAS